METPQELSAFDSIDKVMEAALLGIEILKSQSSFWERLVILDGATLALSLTAAAAFKGLHLPPHDGGAGYLLAAWKFFILSATLGLVTQWVLTLCLSQLTTAMFSFKVSIFALRHKDEKREGLFLSNFAPSEESSKAMKAVAIARLWHWSSYATGGGSAASMLGGFVELFRYVSANLR